MMDITLTKVHERVTYRIEYPMPDIDADPEEVLGKADMPAEWRDLINDGWELRAPTNFVTRQVNETHTTAHAHVDFIRTVPHEKMFEVEAIVDQEWEMQGEPCSLATFLNVNPDLSPHQKAQVVQMHVGDRLTWNLGAAGIVRIRRTR